MQVRCKGDFGHPCVRQLDSKKVRGVGSVANLQRCLRIAGVLHLQGRSV